MTFREFVASRRHVDDVYAAIGTPETNGGDPQLAPCRTVVHGLRCRMKTITLDEYQISPRVTLRRGDKFRVAAGPYWRRGDGTKIPLATRGVCTFLAAVRRGKVVIIEAMTKDGFAVLHVEGRRRRVDTSLVCRPYRIRGRVQKKGVAR